MPTARTNADPGLRPRVVLDDVLTTFDETRAAAALELTVHAHRHTISRVTNANAFPREYTEDPSRVRSGARQKGLDVGEPGRTPAEVLDA